MYDMAAVAYTRPFFLQSDGQALRMFTDIATDAEHEVGKHPEDYSLIRIGIYDDQSGQLVDQSNETLATALEVVASSRERALATRQGEAVAGGEPINDESYGGTG